MKSIHCASSMTRKSPHMLFKGLPPVFSLAKSLVLAGILLLCPTVQVNASGLTSLRCNEFDGSAKMSTLVLDLSSGVIRWTWNDMYRDYEISRNDDRFVYARSEDPAFLYEMKIDKQSLYRAERRKALFLEGVDWSDPELTQCFPDEKQGAK